jgi:hypothetical protein
MALTSTFHPHGAEEFMITQPPDARQQHDILLMSHQQDMSACEVY